MWLLECAGKDFDGKRLWLRPGKKYLFGRTSSELAEASIVISHKTISRKHLIIAVSPVQEGASEIPAKRSKVTVEDCKTKSGTLVNGEMIKGEAFAVQDDLATLKLGLYDVEFQLRWHPVVISTNFSHKDIQAGALVRLRNRFEQLDVKLINEYRTTEVTHVISKKRNTPKGLQALINGHYVITIGFLDAIANAAAPLDGANAASLLEEDYDGAWPHELLYLPSKGNEKSDRPDPEYRPDRARRDIFDGYTFVFYDQTQCDNVHAAITTGKGKALAYHVTPSDTAIDDFIRYAKSVAGEKGLGSFEDGSEGKGVVVVRHTANKGEDSDWFRTFFETISLRLDHRPIDQAEFIDAILRKEPGMLRRPLQAESPRREQMQRAQAAGVPPPPPPQEMDIGVPATTQESAQDTAQSPFRKGRARRPIKKRFAGFVSDDDMGEAPVIAESFENPAAAEPAPASALPPPDSQGLFVTQERFPEQEAPPARVTRAPRNTGTSSRKRTTSPLDDEPDLMDSIAPTAAARKRQRLEAGEDARPRGPSAEATAAALEPRTESTAVDKTIKKKGKEPVDVLEFARKKNEEDEARRLAELEEMAHLARLDIDLAAIRNLAIVEDIKPVRRCDREVAGKDQERDKPNSRWDPRWNGRKNFKKFRRRGEAQGRAPTRTIVQLDQAKAHTFGIGDDYWLKEEQARPIQKQKMNASMSMTARGRWQRNVVDMPNADGLDGDEVMDVSPFSVAAKGWTRGRPQHAEPEVDLVVESDPEPTPAKDAGYDPNAEPDPTPPPPPPPASVTRHGTRTRRPTQSVVVQTPSSKADTQPTQQSTSTRSMRSTGKRPTTTRENLQEPAPKRVRKPCPLPVASESPGLVVVKDSDDNDDDDDDENMKFRFRGRRKR